MPRTLPDKKPPQGGSSDKGGDILDVPSFGPSRLGIVIISNKSDDQDNTRKNQVVQKHAQLQCVPEL